MQANNYWQRDWKGILAIIAVIAGIFSIVLYMKKRNTIIARTEKVFVEKRKVS